MPESDKKNLKTSGVVSDSSEYLNFFENAGIGIYRATPDGKHIRANPALLRLNGFISETDHQRALSKSLAESTQQWYVDPAKRAKLLERLGKENKFENEESEIYRLADRKKLWVTENAWNVFDEDGNILYYEGTIEDISERKRMEFFQEALLQFIEDNLERGHDETFYQRLLERAVNVVPNTQAGSILLKDADENFRFAATVNFNYEGLKEFIIAPHELLVDPNHPEAQIIHDYNANPSFDPARLKILEEHGRVLELKASLSIPIILDGEVAALLHLNNFDTRDAFTEEAKQIVGIFAKQVASLLKRLNAEKELLAKQEKLEHWAKFRTGLIGFMTETLKRGLDEQFYQDLLNKAVKVIPGTQAGSILCLNADQEYAYVAALGYDLAALQSIRFQKNELRMDQETQASLIAEDLITHNQKALSKTKQERLLAVGRVNEIKSFLSVPVVINKKIVALLNLDAFYENAFDSDAKEMADAFATQIGILIQRLNLEQELETSHSRLFKLANYDALTQLPNRYLFNDRLNQAISQANRTGKPVSLLYLDLDGFKTINDSLGHSFGDKLLECVAHRLNLCVRESDTVARLGGDEFAIILTDLEQRQNSNRTAKSILEALSQSFRFDLEERDLHISTSIGIASYPDDGYNSEDLLKHADLAMYYAKAEGKNRYHFFNATMNKQLLEDLSLEQAMRQGLHNEEFKLVYQPRIHLNTGQVTSYEALLRWHHPELGLISPLKFIPLAEKSDFICQLGENVLRQACQQTKKLHQQGTKVRMAVNLSARQIHQDNFVQSIKDILNDNQLDAKWLELEITESTAMTNVEQTIDVLAELQEMGIYISVDDFGTAYSSLNYLKRLPINSLKIDRSFVKDIISKNDSSADAAIIKAIIALANSMRYTVVAEGVETQEQLAFLQQLGCQEAQGYLFAKPKPAFELSKTCYKDLVNAELLSEVLA